MLVRRQSWTQTTLSLTVLVAGLACSPGGGDGDGLDSTSSDPDGSSSGPVSGDGDGDAGDGDGDGDGDAGDGDGEGSGDGDGEAGDGDGEAGDGDGEGSGDGDGDGGFVPEEGDRSALYPADWTPGFSVDDPNYDEPLFIQDYSYAGYHMGEVELPSGDFAPVTEVDAPNDGSADATAAIQAAIDIADDAGGGIVYLPPGKYRIDSELQIAGSNIVLRGAGSGQTYLWFRNAGALSVTGDSWLSLDEGNGDDWQLVGDGAVFETSVTVNDASAFAPGDDIAIAWLITNEFRAEHGSSDYWSGGYADGLQSFFRRTVTSVEGNTIHFEVPLRYPVKTRDAAQVVRVDNYANEIGIEGFSLTNAVGVDQAWAGPDSVTAIYVRFCKNCWIRDIHSYAEGDAEYHLRSHGIRIERSLQVTVADCDLQKAEHLGGGGNGYLYQINQSNNVLVRDSIGSEGRHNFTINWSFADAGHVFQRVHSAGGRVCSTFADMQNDDCSVGPSDFHHPLSIAVLWDNSTIEDALQVGNRVDKSSNAGHTATQSVFWNLDGSGSVYSYNVGLGYVIGTSAELSVDTDTTLQGWPWEQLALDSGPEDYTEYLGGVADLAPTSLYDEQLARRLDR